MPKNISLTEVELEFMCILWKLGEGTVRDVLSLLPAERHLAYTSVSTILRILEQKRVLTSRKEGRGHVYVPRVQKAEYENSLIHQVVDTVFDGEPLSLMRQLLDSSDLTQADVGELKKMLEERFSQ